MVVYLRDILPEVAPPLVILVPGDLSLGLGMVMKR